MFGRKSKNKNTCGYWDCKKGIPDDAFLCSDHYAKWVEGLIDRCPKCGRFKDLMYYQCLDCYLGRQVKPKKLPAVIPEPKQSHQIEYSEAWTDGHLKPDRWFIYILGFDDGTLYIGRTRDIHSRFSELREQKTSPTAGHNPRLEYLETAASEKAAELREAELKRLAEWNPSQIEAMTIEFHSHMREWGFEKD